MCACVSEYFCVSECEWVCELVCVSMERCAKRICIQCASGDIYNSMYYFYRLTVMIANNFWRTTQSSSNFFSFRQGELKEEQAISAELQTKLKHRMSLIGSLGRCSQWVNIIAACPHHYRFINPSLVSLIFLPPSTWCSFHNFLSLFFFLTNLLSYYFFFMFKYSLSPYNNIETKVHQLSSELTSIKCMQSVKLPPLNSQSGVWSGLYVYHIIECSLALFPVNISIPFHLSY